MENSSPTSPNVFRKDNPFLYDHGADVKQVCMSPVSTDTSAESERHMSGPKKNGLTFSALPMEVVLEIARYLDMQSTARCRQTCTKLRDTVPAPSRPLAMTKT
jgi:hypothetical protein